MLASAGKRLNPVVTLGRVAIISFGVLVMYYLLTFLLWGSLMGEIRTAARAVGVL